MTKPNNKMRKGAGNRTMAKCEGGCGKNPSFNYPGEKQRVRCFSCKLPGQIDIKNPRCIGAQCTKYPNYNFPNHSKRLYCSKCKKIGM
eukprot:Pgem_evm1s4849